MSKITNTIEENSTLHAHYENNVNRHHFWYFGLATLLYAIFKHFKLFNLVHNYHYLYM